MSNDDISAALHLISRLGLTIDDLAVKSPEVVEVPTFRAYIKRVAAAVPQTTLDNYRTYWKAVEEVWAERLITEPTYTEIQQLVTEYQARAAAAPRSNSRGGRAAAAQMVSAIRKLYRHAEQDRLIHPLENPSVKVPRPRQLSSTRHALTLQQVHALGYIASSTGNDRPLDALIVRILIETACRKRTLLHLTIDDLDVEDCLMRLREKGGTIRWQPISPPLMHKLIEHVAVRGGPATTRQVLRYRSGKPIGRRRIDHLFDRFKTYLPWAATLGISPHWIRHTTLTFVERLFGIAVARAFAGHNDAQGASSPTTFTYVRAGLLDIVEALVALTGEPHPLLTDSNRHPLSPNDWRNRQDPPVS
ncbi:tyrosine-type recombinase/integrase [Nocardia sp. GCM10030253]|uniref:tyrosine-type recombinase/integrase n=1 Tax=Nocardia sp. GCM10030253 TaxID=3273404 RepID=UPI00363C4807